MIIAKRVRIVHSVVEDLFQVQYKTWIFGKWINDAQYRYHAEGQMPSPHSGKLWHEEGALTKAKQRSQVLLGRVVVCDDSR